MANTSLDEKERFGSKFLRKRGWLHLQQLTLTDDLADIGDQFGIRFTLRLIPNWRGPWQFDREHNVWLRPYGFDDDIHWQVFRP